MACFSINVVAKLSLTKEGTKKENKFIVNCKFLVTTSDLFLNFYPFSATLPDEELWKSSTVFLHTFTGI